MRKELYCPQVNKEKMNRIKNLIAAIVENPNRNDSFELNELNRITGTIYTGIEFAEYWGWTDLDTLAEKVSMPEPPCVRDLTKDEVKEIVLLIKCFMISDDNIAEYYMELLHKSLSLPDVLKYIRLEDDEETITNNLIQASLNSVITL